VGLGYTRSDVADAGGDTSYNYLELPLTVLWDTRDDKLSATSGYYLDAGVTPFLGFGSTGTGAKLTGDARAYRSLGENGRFVLAGRVQFGTIVGAGIEATPRDYLIYSGGGGTVRGQPYQSLGVMVLSGGTVESGGRSFLGLSGELRAGITDKIGVVAFYDAGYISAGELFDQSGEWHAGAGLGLRYDTGIGPIRLDIAAPVSGSTGDGVQVYVGIGQAF
jgi:translocation and assembly module TamA